nr:ribosomal protein S18-alanine N-acetyltransferase [Variovorax boronicumulans]
MSALPERTGEARFEPMTEGWLTAVVAIEQQAYTHPWTRRNFQDALASGYQAQVLLGDSEVLGYFIAMKGVDEVHLLNITVAPAHQRRGWARVMLDALCLWARGQRAQWLWLEVRVSNLRAFQIYAAYGFRRVGLRKGYYPESTFKREDAIVMSLQL